MVGIAPIGLPTCLAPRGGQGMGLSLVSMKKDRKTVTEQCAGGKTETVSNFIRALTDYRGKDEFGLWQLHFQSLLAPRVLGQAQ